MTTVFTFNRHPAYLYLLSQCDVELVIAGSWDDSDRPAKPNMNFVTPSEITAAMAGADVWLSHLIYPDLSLFLKEFGKIAGDRRIVQVMHGSVNRVGDVSGKLARTLYSSAKKSLTYPLDLLPSIIDVEYVYITDYVARSWKMNPARTIYPGALLDEISPTTDRGEVPLTVGNNLNRRHFAGEELRKLYSAMEMSVCGANNEPKYTPGRLPWSELIEAYQSCLCYVNLLQPPENSFNLATIEAMCAGAPIVTLSHPESVFTHEENALVCDSVESIESAIDRIRTDDDLRVHLSKAARDLAESRFSMQRFTTQWQDTLNVR